MNAIFTVLTILVIIAAILLILVVLLQNGKGDGMASNFVAGNQTFGVRQTADLLEKITWGLVAFIFVISIIATFTTRSESSLDVTDKVEQTSEKPSVIDFDQPATVGDILPEQSNPAQEAPAQEVPAEPAK